MSRRGSRGDGGLSHPGPPWGDMRQVSGGVTAGMRVRGRMGVSHPGGTKGRAAESGGVDGGDKGPGAGVGVEQAAGARGSSVRLNALSVLNCL